MSTTTGQEGSTIIPFISSIGGTDAFDLANFQGVLRALHIRNIDPVGEYNMMMLFLLNQGIKFIFF